MSRGLPYFHDGEIVKIDFANNEVTLAIRTIDDCTAELKLSEFKDLLTKGLNYQNIVFDVDIWPVDTGNIEQIILELDVNFPDRHRRDREKDVYTDGKTFYVCVEPSNGLLLMALLHCVEVRWLDRTVIYGEPRSTSSG